MDSGSVPGSPDPRIRCTRGWRGQSCKKRRCSICGVRWARDWRRVLFEALKAPGVPVVLSAVTPPGATDLPWDERGCDHLGPHKHSSRLGCRVDGDALAAWSLDVSRRWKRLHNAARNACKRETGRCLPLATRAWEPQARGPGHVHPVFHLYSPADVAVARCYLEHLARLAPRHGFGFVGEKEGKGMQIMAGSSGRVSLELLRSWEGIEGDAAGECEESPPTSNAYLGSPESHRDYRCDDAEPASVSAAVGGADGAPSSAVVVRCGARADRAAGGVPCRPHRRGDPAPEYVSVACSA